MTHPPIPPDCPYFRDGWFVIPGPTGRIIGLDDPGDWRPVIAAVGEVAWLREAERFLCEVMVDIAQYNAAIQNAMAWRRWGWPE